MAPAYRIGRKNDTHTRTKRTVKYLASCTDPRIQRAILQGASDSVYKSICNAFFNIAENPDINLTKQQRKRFQKFNPVIRKIIATEVPLNLKKKIIQRGGGPFLVALLPAVISAALSLIGSAFIKPQQ